jgi:hypothetical protein
VVVVKKRVETMKNCITGFWKWFAVLPYSEIAKIVPGQPPLKVRLSLHLMKRQQMGTLNCMKKLSDVLSIS